MAEQEVGFISLGCPKALVDTEHLLTDLAAAGYALTSEPGALTVVNTCGFIDAARDESLETIQGLLDDGRKVIVTGCLGHEVQLLRQRFPELIAITGPTENAGVLAAVEQVLGKTGSTEYLMGPAGIKLTPPHYSYLKISEGCNHNCTFCIIPDLRGRLRSRPIDEVLTEATTLVAAGTRELLVVAQDTSAYGVDLRYAERRWADRQLATDMITLAAELGRIAPWVRLHYVYPYPNVDQLIPLMADGIVLPYLDMPLQHASPAILKAMRRPGQVEKMLRRIESWRTQCPDLCIRSTFIVGFPGETDEDFAMLLDFLDAAQLDRVGCFTYSAVQGAKANALPDAVDERDKLDRQEILMETQAAISAARLRTLIGSVQTVLVDGLNDSGDEAAGAFGRSSRDAPDVDGVVHLYDVPSGDIRPGDFVQARILETDEHDMHAEYLGRNLNNPLN